MNDMISTSKPLKNDPTLWFQDLPWPEAENNKYDRGYTLVWGGQAKRAGAAKLAALAALRTGSGLVSIVCKSSDVPVYAASALSLMTEAQQYWKELLADTRKNTVVIGPGAGVNKATKDAVLLALKAKKRTVLDADAITVFAKAPQKLFTAIQLPCVLTPHAGEFARLFPDIRGGRVEMAREAASLSRAIVVLKGHETVIACPDGQVAVNGNAPANLATAGTGDVLSGIISGLLAQGMEAFKAASAAVWIHAEAARQQPAGLIAEDLLTHLPQVLQKLKLMA